LLSVAERFGGGLRIGVRINSGVVIAETIGGAGKLEFTLIGDTVNTFRISAGDFVCALSPLSSTYFSSSR
jgi:class 3 adenylate cyclase